MFEARTAIYQDGLVQGYVMHLSMPSKDGSPGTPNPMTEPKTRFRDVLELRHHLHENMGFKGMVTAYKEKK